MIRPLFALAPFLFACALQANFSLPQILSDGMVLQQGKPVGIWGKGEEGAQVKAWLNGQDGKTKVKNGEWSITFDPYEAGGPFELTIQSGEKTRIIKDILIGEVWIAGGRSDMQWSSNGSIHRKQELPLKANGRIRVFKQTRRSTATPQFDTLPANGPPRPPKIPSIGTPWLTGLPRIFKEDWGFPSVCSSIATTGPGQRIGLH